MVSSLDRTFAALSDPTRRGLLATLAQGPRTVGDLAQPLPISLVAVIKHLTVLERAGLVRRTRRGRTVECALTAAPLGDAEAWLRGYQSFWSQRLDGLTRYLEETP